MQLTPHFSADELRYFDAPTDEIRGNLRRLALLLEDVRAVLGVPLRVTSGYRSPLRNQEVAGASATSQHMDGTAADVVPVGLDVQEALGKLSASPVLAKVGQVIAYPFTGGHLHISMPTRGTIGQALVNMSHDASTPRYVAFAAPAGSQRSLASRAPLSTQTAILVVAAAVGVALLDVNA